MATLNVPLLALIISTFALMCTIVCSVVVVVWRFSTLSSKMENLTQRVEDLIAEDRSERSKVEVLSKDLAVLQVRVAALELCD